MERETAATQRAENLRQPFAVQSLTPTDPMFEEVIAQILAMRGEAPADVRSRVYRLLQHVRDQSLVLASVVAAISSGRCLSAAMLIETPGSLGALFLPARGIDRSTASAILERVCGDARDRGLTLVQCLCRPEEINEQNLLAEAGFEFLAELAYLERPARERPGLTQVTPQLEFETYSPANRPEFLETLAATYQGSCDCPKLNGIRRPQDVLATHRATGIFDPALWSVARFNGQLSAVLLLAGVHGRSALEIVYMGVAHTARRKGLGHALIRHAVEQCRRTGKNDLVLAVDTANQQAMHLYERWHFHETHRRRAWISCNIERGGPATCENVCANDVGDL